MRLRWRYFDVSMCLVVNIPPALHEARDVTPHLRTWQVKTHERMVSATASVVVRVVHPDEAPCFMLMKPEGLGGSRADMTGWWVGHGDVQVWAANELLALERLFTTLDGLGLPVPDGAREVHAALAAGAGAKPTHASWPTMPLGLRGLRPRRERHKFKSPITGKITRIYKDTLRQHDDTTCTCPGCTMLIPPTETDE